MATIRTAIEVQDRFSSAIDRLNAGLQIAINRFTQLNTAMNSNPKFNGVDRLDSKLRNTQSVVNNVNNTLNNTNNILNNTTNNIQNINNRLGDTNNMIVNINNRQNQLNDNISRSSVNADGLLGTIKKIAATYLGIQAIKGIFNASDSYMLTQSRLGLMNDGLQTTAQLNDKIFQSAERSRSSYIETAKSVAKLAILARDAFSSNDETVAFAEQMNKQFKIGGASIQEQTAGMYQLTQAMAAGKLQGDEFRSIRENAPLLAQAIATYTGKSMGELNKMSSEGEITANIIKKSLFAAADEANARFEKLPKTIGDVGTKIKNNAMKIFAPILTRINEIVNYNFDSIVGNILGVMRMISGIATDIINIGVSIGTFLQNNWGTIAPIVMGVVGAYVAFNLISSATSMILGAQALAHGVAGAAAMLQAGETMAATTAQWGLNAALYACPITWVVIAIIAFIAILYLAVAAINRVKGTSYSATGLIAGAFMAVGAVVYNVVAFIWNTFAAFYEFFLNVGIDKTYAVRKLFANLALNVINSAISMTRGIDQFATSMANAIIDAINISLKAWDAFVSVLSAVGIAEKLGLKSGGRFQQRVSITSDMENIKSNLEASVANAPDGYKTVQRMESKDPINEFKKYYAWGSNTSNMFDNFKLPGSDGKDPTNYDDLLKNADDTAGNTKGIKDKMDITEEDLKYLRDIAEQEVINRFTTAEIKVDMTNNNTINSDMDIDGVIHSFGEGLHEHLQTVAEGATYDNV
ncbi:hypothetical protein CLPUN_03020 [Clostridium puniceum]|uniref:Tape measure protein N-terminal domain-containing protein n=1 Tax=Clostridium puniceum TaxID=29367 RepID=A0A1S8TX06_9CLOT|nr:tape measure protein [Clostridium puniceum]OOM82333.1 hypothetical protein CLPUN_03020 [Clostridium puniceum]